MKIPAISGVLRPAYKKSEMSVQFGSRRYLLSRISNRSFLHRKQYLIMTTFLWILVATLLIFSSFVTIVGVDDLHKGIFYKHKFEFWLRVIPGINILYFLYFVLYDFWFEKAFRDWKTLVRNYKNINKKENE